MDVLTFRFAFRLIIVSRRVWVSEFSPQRPANELQQWTGRKTSVFVCLQAGEANELAALCGGFGV